jgi:NAD(P)-dependent dehydrogenase (short-subunit alcohol dehydrogenase family)
VPTVLVNNAGITRDQILLRMKEEDWDAVIETDLRSVFRLSKACLRGHDEGARRAYHQYRLGGGVDGQSRAGELRGGQGRDDGFQPFAGARDRLTRDHGQRGGARVSSTPT